MPVREFHIAPDPDTVIVLRSPCVNFAPWEEIGTPVEEVAQVEVIADDWGFFSLSKKEKKKMKKRRETRVADMPVESEEAPVEPEEALAACEDAPVELEVDQPISVEEMNEVQPETPPPELEEEESPVVAQESNFLYGSDAGNASYPALKSVGETVMEGTGASPGLSKDENHSNDVTVISAQDEQQDSDEAARYYVSSRHLITASPCFHRMLTKDKWNESERDKKDGLFHLSAEDWDVDAFLLLLNIFHLKNRQVPRKVSLDDLAKIAVLVDYYECAEAIELFSDMWIENLIETIPIPSKYCRTLVLWIWIAWIFERAHEFKSATLVAIKQCSEPISTLGLPIPGRVSENVDIRRYASMEHTIEGLHSLRDKYESSEYQCPLNPSRFSFDCGSLLYGAITKEMRAIKLISPRPEIPFQDMSFDKLCANVRKMKSPTWHEEYSRNYGYYNDESCNLKTAVTAVVENIDSTVTGLDLVSLKARKSVGAM